MDKTVEKALTTNGSDKTYLVNILWHIQREKGHIPPSDVIALAQALNMSPLDVRETISFYHFFHDTPAGKHRIYLSDSAIARMSGHAEVRAALEQETAAGFGGSSPDGMFTLADTACIGLSDQEPAMLLGDVVFTELTPQKVAQIIAALKAGKHPEEVANPARHDSTSLEYVESMVSANIRRKGPVLFQGARDHSAILTKALALHPEELIDEVVQSNIRGRGGAGFPTGLKWRLGHEAEGRDKYIICNADEGEPGTFKDRVLLSHSPMDLLLGMVMGAHAVGANHGIIYLRAEYWYLKDYLERHIREANDAGLLGNNILDSGLNFDIRIQMGAGAYICGDETALIESCEGKRGTPRIKPPYPIQQGFLGQPTIVNNVETFAAISRIIEENGEWFNAMGTMDSSGTRILSISGDCETTGIYEVEWGMSLADVLKMAGARAPMAVQISGPSGECASVAKDATRELCYSDLSCNGSFMVFDENRDLLDIVRQFMEFFVEESCGICTPCRAGGVDMLCKIKLVIAGRAEEQDLQECRDWGELMRTTSRCGLGTTAAKPILTTLEKFPDLYQEKLSCKPEGDVLRPSFDMEAALSAHGAAWEKLVVEARK